MPKILFVLALFLIPLALFPAASFAQATATSTTKMTSVTVATVNIYNAKIITQKGNAVTVTFDLFNRVGVQSGIKYSVSLVNPQTGNVADEHVYSEVVALADNQTITKTITYTAPTSILAGTYKLWLKSNNDRGLPLALADLGNITLTTSNIPKIEILADTCYLTVDGEKPVNKYTLRQGVDIADTESLIATCKVYNTVPVSKIASKTTPASIPTFTPTFETHFRTIYGDKVAQTGGATSSVTIAYGTSTISIALPKALRPQAYDVLFSLVNPNKSIASNTVNFHYVLRGLSGTVQNTIFDKLSYKKGDIALLQIFTSDSADGFQGSRLGHGTESVAQKLDVTVTDTAGIICGSYTSKSTRLDGRGTNVPITMMEDCDGPIAQVTLGATTDANQAPQTLDSKSFQNPLPPTPEGMTDKELAIIVSIVSGFLLLIALIIRLYESR